MALAGEEFPCITIEADLNRKCHIDSTRMETFEKNNRANEKAWFPCAWLPLLSHMHPLLADDQNSAGLKWVVLVQGRSK